MIPMYISYITGLSVKELREDKRGLFRVFINSLFFVLGFTIIFTLLALILYILVSGLGEARVWFDRIAGLVIIIFGLHIMGVINIRFLNYQAKIDKKSRKTGVLSSFLMGIVFGAGWTPCIGPILSGILFTSASAQNPVLAALLLVVFSMGIGIPFILTAVATNRFLAIFEGIKRHYRTIEIISGVFLIILGVLVGLSLMEVISAWIMEALPGLAEVEFMFSEKFGNIPD
jgi:cytochrome c-type biogenesis protein